MKQIFYGLLIVSLLIAGCSVTEKATKKTEKKIEVIKKVVNEVKLKIEKNIGWINLMPGTAPKFHVSGKLTLLKSDTYEINSTILKFIKVYQSGKELYFIQPKVIEEISGENKLITYSTIRGLSLNNKLNRKKSVEFEFVFKEGKKELLFRQENINVDEVH